MRKINWRFPLFYLLLGFFCYICWLGIVQFVKIIAKGMGW